MVTQYSHSWSLSSWPGIHLTPFRTPHCLITFIAEANLMVLGNKLPLTLQTAPQYPDWLMFKVITMRRTVGYGLSQKNCLFDLVVTLCLSVL